MICPKCGTEYREGFNECAYCHIPLVESLEEGVDPEELYRRNEAGKDEPEKEYLTKEEFLELARKKGLSDRNIMDAFEEARDADDLPGVYTLDREALEAEAEEKSEEYDMTIKPFKKASDRAEDLKSSAYTLLIVGVFGLIAAFLFYIGAIPVNFTTAGRYVTTITMSAMFILFLITGINSVRKIGPLNEEAEREEQKIEEIRSFFFDEYDRDKLDALVNADKGESEDEYFLRVRHIKDIINDRFLGLDPSFLEYIVDDIYTELYEEK